MRAITNFVQKSPVNRRKVDGDKYWEAPLVGFDDGLITEKGQAMRVGSVVTDLPLKPSEKIYPHHRANCLYFFNNTCKACAARCPAGAISSKGHDKDKCFEYSYRVALRDKKAEYGVEITGCGLCQTKVPCEFKIPKLIQKELQKQTPGTI